MDILKDMYEEISIPSVVFQEMTAKDDSVCVQIRLAGDWIRVEQIKDHSEKKMYKAKLHDGEVEVMILAQEQEADLMKTMRVFLRIIVFILYKKSGLRRGF